MIAITVGPGGEFDRL